MGNEHDCADDLPWSITEPSQKKTREIVSAKGVTIAKLTALDIPTAERIVKAVNGMAGASEELRRMGSNFHALIDKHLTLQQTCASQQAKIDALMLEYCPDEMTPAQIAQWAAHQKPARLQDMSTPSRQAENVSKKPAEIDTSRPSQQPVDGLVQHAEGGLYRNLGQAKPAGTAKQDIKVSLQVYVSQQDGQLYYRIPSDFASRFLPAPEQPCPLCDDTMPAGADWCKRCEDLAAPLLAPLASIDAHQPALCSPFPGMDQPWSQDDKGRFEAALDKYDEGSVPSAAQQGRECSLTRHVPLRYDNKTPVDARVEKNAALVIQELIDSHKRDTKGECDVQCDIVAGMEAARDAVIAAQGVGHA